MRLLEIISEVRNVAIALGQFQTKHVDTLSYGDAKDLDTMIDSLNCIYKEGRYHAGKVSIVKYLVEAYDKFKVSQRKRKRREPRRIVRGSTVVRELRAFVKKHNILCYLKKISASLRKAILRQGWTVAVACCAFP